MTKKTIDDIVEALREPPRPWFKIKPTVNEILEGLKRREEHCWLMSKVFLENKDPHGLHDMGVEIQALQRAKTEVEKLGAKL